MAIIRKYYGPILLIFATACYVGFKLYDQFKFNSRYQNPQKGDIYLFLNEESYSPYLLDLVSEDSLYFFSHPFDYSNSIPSYQEILHDSFHSNIHYIYQRTELQRLKSENKIIKIYR